jgi:hypothetical protein
MFNPLDKSPYCVVTYTVDDDEGGRETITHRNKLSDGDYRSLTSLVENSVTVIRHQNEGRNPQIIDVVAGLTYYD